MNKFMLLMLGGVCKSKDGTSSHKEGAPGGVNGSKQQPLLLPYLSRRDLESPFLCRHGYTSVSSQHWTLSILISQRFRSSAAFVLVYSIKALHLSLLSLKHSHQKVSQLQRPCRPLQPETAQRWRCLVNAPLPPLPFN